LGEASAYLFHWIISKLKKNKTKSADDSISTLSRQISQDYTYTVESMIDQVPLPPLKKFNYLLLAFPALCL
jgi:hypothetical protein